MATGIHKHKAVKLLTAILAGWMASLTLNAQRVELNLDFRKESIEIGEQTELIAAIRKNQDVNVQYFAIRDSLDRNIEIADSLTTTGADSVIIIFKLTSFTPGEYKIPSVPLVFSYHGNTDTLYSSPLVLTVLSPGIDEQADIRDIKPPLNLPFKLREILPETGITLVVLGLLTILLLYILRRFQKKKIMEIAERALPPHVFALRELDRLKEEKLWQKGRIKEYYSKLSDIIRGYLEKRFNIPAMEYVSSETMQSFRSSMPNETMLGDMLEGILVTSDMVKFAKEDPLPAINIGNMDNAYLFIGQTKIEELISLEEKMDEFSKNRDKDNDKIKQE